MRVPQSRSATAPMIFSNINVIDVEIVPLLCRNRYIYVYGFCENVRRDYKIFSAKRGYLQAGTYCAGRYALYNSLLY